MTELMVYLDGLCCGVVTQTAGEALTFDYDVAGAVQLLPPGYPSSDHADSPSRFEPLSDDQVEQLLAAVVDEYRDGRPHPDTAQRFSLAGAQPKIALHRGPAGWARPLGSTPTTHILKPTPGTYRRLDLVEHLTMRAATHLGLTVAGVCTRRTCVNHWLSRRTRSTSTVTEARGFGPSQPCCGASRSGPTERRRLKAFPRADAQHRARVHGRSRQEPLIGSHRRPGCSLRSSETTAMAGTIVDAVSRLPLISS